MSNFKPGDMVVCVSPGGYHLTLDKQYRVESVSRRYVWVKNDRGRVGGLRNHRFELATEVSLPPAPQSVRYYTSPGMSNYLDVLTDIHGDIEIRANSAGDRFYNYLSPNAALQLASDLTRMAMELKRKSRV